MILQIRRSISLTLLGISLLNYSALIILMTTRRLMQPLKIRLYLLAVFHYLAEMILLAICLSRLILGEERFPCIIYKASVFLCTPGIIAPWFLNGLRVTFVFRTGRVKERYRTSNLLNFSSQGSNDKLDTLDQENSEKKDSFGGSIFGGNSFDEPSFNPKKKKDDHMSDFLNKKHFFLRVGNIFFRKWTILAIVFFETFCASLFFILELLIQPTTRNLNMGCQNSIPIMVGYCLYGFVHVVLMFIVMIGQCTMKERFMLKWENRLLWIVVSSSLIFLIIWSFAPYVETYFPILWIIFIVFMLDSIISGWIPTMMTLKSTYGFQWVEDTGNFDPTKVKSLMMNAISRNYFMDFCQQEFSLENPNLWLDIQYFNASPSNQRNNIAGRIADTYLRSGSPMQVNISNTLRREFLNRIDNPSIQITKEFFEELQLSIENNMLDTFSRFIHSDKFQQMMSELEKRNQHLKSFQAI